MKAYSLKKNKALALFSGGLDSILAVKIIEDLGIKVEGITFTTRFFSRDTLSVHKIIKSAEDIGLKLKIVDISKEYLKILKKPRYGYGSGINPCIDCKILMLKKAKEYADKKGFDFLFSGEVVGERPMSQNLNSLRTIEKQAGATGKLLRPLSAKLLPDTEAEKKGIVDREKLYSIEGRVRQKQIELAEKFNVKSYPKPAGGCLLCEKSFFKRVKDLFENNKNYDVSDMEILKYGRHFRFGVNKLVVGRNEQENEILLGLKKKSDYIFEVPYTGSPITILQGNKNKESIKLSAQVTASYSDSKEKEVIVNYGKDLEKKIKADNVSKKNFSKYII